MQERAMIQIDPIKRGVYCFRVSKRAQRAGWIWDGRPTNERFFCHAQDKIRWIDATLEQAQEAQALADYRRITDVLPPSDQDPISRDRVRQLAKVKLNVGKNKADTWLRLSIEDKLIETVKGRTENNRSETRFRRAKSL